MLSSNRLTREQKGKKVATSPSPDRDQEAIHRETMMDRANLDRVQRLFISESMVQFRSEDDGQDAVDDPMVPICFYPGNICS